MPPLAPLHQPVGIHPVPVTAIDELKWAIRLLSGMDNDGATVRNNIGFSGRDTRRGNRLAEYITRWRPEEAERALEVAGHYANTQLARAGLRVPAASEVAAALAEPGALARANALASVTVEDSGDGCILVRFDYHPDLVAICQQIRAQHQSEPFDRVKRAWKFPVAARQVVEQAFYLSSKDGALLSSGSADSQYGDSEGWSSQQ